MKGIERQRVGLLPVWGWAIVASALVWLLYAFTLGPTTAFWDTSEYITTAYILGLPHPPGNPLFVLIGRTWLILTAWTGLEVATRINLLSATVSAIAAGFWFLAVMRIWAHFTENRAVALTAAFVSVLVGATAYTVWAQSNVNEKVYTVSLMFVAVISYLAMLWEDHSDTWRGSRIFLLVLFLLGLGWSNHQMSILPVLALLVFLLAAVYFSIKTPKALRTIIAYALCTVTVVGLGYYGGELVFGKKEPVTAPVEGQTSEIPADITAGSLAFGQQCSRCHYADRTDFKMGPGLKGLFRKEKLHGSDWPVTEANVRKQIVAPFGTMPAYRDMSEETLDAMMAYLRTL